MSRPPRPIRASEVGSGTMLKSVEFRLTPLLLVVQLPRSAMAFLYCATVRPVRGPV